MLWVVRPADASGAAIDRRCYVIVQKAGFVVLLPRTVHTKIAFDLAGAEADLQPRRVHGLICACDGVSIMLAFRNP